MELKVIGIDIAKTVFQVCGMDGRGKVVLSCRLSRGKLFEFMANLPACLVGMESCSGSQYWARRFKGLGHDVRLMSPQFVKPYVKSNKNDQADAEAICEAVTRPTMRFVSLKSIEQQDIQCLHRIRTRVVEEKVSLVNQIRGLLLEYGIVVSQGISFVRKKLPEILDEEDSSLSGFARSLFRDLYQQLVEIDEKVKRFDQQIKALSRQSPLCEELEKIPGVGPITATAIIAAAGNGSVFKNGRQFAAWLGLVPRQQSSGNKQILLGISKRGDKYLRKLLIHGARAIISRSRNLSLWLESLLKRSGKYKTYVALANKNARMIWAVLRRGEYKPAI